MPSLWVGLLNMMIAAQVTPAVVSGTIRDAQGAVPLPGAVVLLVDIDRAVVSDSAGRYVFRGVPPGPHHLSVRRIGFTPRTLHALVPTRGHLEIDIALHAEPVRLGTVDVHPNILVRGVDAGDSTAFPNRGISMAAARNHPLLAEPDALLALGGGEVVLRPETPSGMHLRGGASDQTAYNLDGIPVFSPYHAAGMFSAWNPDALERLQLTSSGEAGLSGALSGEVSGLTRTPGDRPQLQGTISTTQWRATVDGPLGPLPGGYLLSFRQGFPDAIAPKDESSYLNGETTDLLAKLELPLLGGGLRLLRYESSNEIGSTATLASTLPTGEPFRNTFEWLSRSSGGEWNGRVGSFSAVVRAWSSDVNAHALWDASEPTAMTMRAWRRDRGLLVAGERRSSGSTTSIGMRVNHSRTSYDVLSIADQAKHANLSVRTPLASFYASHERPLATNLAGKIAFTTAVRGDDIFPAPFASLRWVAGGRLTITGSYGRTHQFLQSLRNSESVVANVFPVDLFLGSAEETSSMPVARSDLALLAADYRLVGGGRLGVQTYVRSLDGLLLVAPRTGDPFAKGEFSAGGGTARGISVDGALSRTRWALLGSYGWQRVRFTHHDTTFTPEHGASHLLEGGLIVFPSTTSSIRIGAMSILGRRATPVSGLLEWEACNLYDRGCEMVGTPRHATDELGGEKLPPYFRVDLGVRKHWHLRIGQRDAMIAVFGTITNVLGRRNLLAVSTDPETGERTEVEMRSRVPLVVGIDWRF
ncbi:MAG TPA: carboxypeptidase-like regulatory domain-containing protein [Gemmatimonadaceae bacterium]|nr:carboxypeptidase-like regulatory domain-containing protein [Gemmatimonadaceae bacterium]